MKTYNLKVTAPVKRVPYNFYADKIESITLYGKPVECRDDDLENICNDDFFEPRAEEAIFPIDLADDEEFDASKVFMFMVEGRVILDYINYDGKIVNSIIPQTQTELAHRS